MGRQRRRPGSVALGMALVLSSGGCQGTGGPRDPVVPVADDIPPAAGAGALAGHVEAPDLPYAAPASTDGALRARAWKLSHREYQRAVLDFVGVEVDISDFEPEIDNGVYPNMSASGLVRPALARDYYAAAERVGDRLGAEQLMPLTEGRALGPAVKDAFLERAIGRAFRRPASGDELAAYGELFELAAAEGDSAEPFRTVVRALLTSPFFLYRTEIGSDTAARDFALTGHEVASFLSFSLLGAPPGDELLQAAERGELRDPTALASHVDALLDTAEAADTWRRFEREWLRIHRFSAVDKDVLLFPGFDAAHDAMEAEAETFLARHGGMSGTLATLLTAPVMPAGELAAFYASEPSSGGQVGRRTGVLALGAVLASRAKATSTSPTLRGLFVRDRFLCQELHLPADLVADVARAQLTLLPRTTRELYALHAEDPTCASCHSLMDPIGFNFEDLDAAGRFRRTENLVTVDTRGELRNSDRSGSTADHGELAARLADSEWVRECLARQAFRFYFGQVEAERGLPPIQQARETLGAGGFRDFVAALMTSTSTLRRVRE